MIKKKDFRITLFSIIPVCIISLKIIFFLIILFFQIAISKMDLLLNMHHYKTMSLVLDLLNAPEFRDIDFLESDRLDWISLKQGFKTQKTEKNMKKLRTIF